MKYKRILVKLSGEALMGDGEFGISPSAIASYANEILEAHKLGAEIGIVIGGGNIFRGLQSASKGLDKVYGDQMGMLATIINSIAFKNILEQKGISAKVMSATMMPQFAEYFSSSIATKDLQEGKIVIFAGGTGNPFFTTDTAAVLRAIEINAEIVIKATNVDGVYDCDPKKNKNAKLYSNITYSEVLEKRLQVMDLTAIVLCQENNCNIGVINLHKTGNLLKFLSGEKIGTIITN